MTYWDLVAYRGGDGHRPGASLAMVRPFIVTKISPLNSQFDR